MRYMSFEVQFPVSLLTAVYNLEAAKKAGWVVSTDTACPAVLIYAVLELRQLIQIIRGIAIRIATDV